MHWRVKKVRKFRPIKNKINITVYSLQMSETINIIAKRLGTVVDIHIKIDTGMTRI
ncbi:MAG: alanine racemase, partial [Oscillospiraceae bacterium]